MTRQLSMYINGKFEHGTSGRWVDVLNPATEDVIAQEPQSNVEDVNRALLAARQAQPAW